MSDLTRLKRRIELGDKLTSDELLPLVYNELRRMAQYRLNQLPNQTIQATGLVHEAYLRLARAPTSPEDSSSPRWDSKGHFFSAAAESMRRILVEIARRKSRTKHGGQFKRNDITLSAIVDKLPDDDVIAIDEVLNQFAIQYPDHAELIKLRFFVGLSEGDAAAILGISRATASRQWRFGRTWLFNEIRKSEKK